MSTLPSLRVSHGQNGANHNLSYEDTFNRFPDYVNKYTTTQHTGNLAASVRSDMGYKLFTVYCGIRNLWEAQLEHLTHLAIVSIHAGGGTEAGVETPQ